MTAKTTPHGPSLPGQLLHAHDADSPFHRGERAVQQAVGVAARAAMVGRSIQDGMADEDRAFFAALPFVVVGSLDAEGRPWASVLAGAKGLLRAPDPWHLEVRATPAEEDPLAAALALRAPLGLLGIQLATRRRNRLNGRVSALTAEGFTVRVDQSFGNCPKYITGRVSQPVAPGESPPVPAAEGPLLSAAALRCIAASDTCFVASASAPNPDLEDAREGVDVSHRGGVPGFVRVTEERGASVLTVPDFAGNTMFNTLGNLARYPRAGIAFLDFEAGGVLLVTGTTEIVFEGPEVSRFEGAQRLTRIRVSAGLYCAGALPFAWSAPVLPAPNQRLGTFKG